MSFLSRRILNQHELATGESPAIVFEHAPTNEAGAYFDFSTPASVDLTATGRSWIRVTAFTRYLRWTTTGTFETPAVVTVDLVARE